MGRVRLRISLKHQLMALVVRNVEWGQDTFT
jgi:hypothetical protein